MAFSSETALGYRDGEHIGFYGPTFPLFVRVIGGKVRVVGKELAGANINKISRIGIDWLKYALPAQKAVFDNPLFDNPQSLNATADTSEPGANFIQTITYSGDRVKEPSTSGTTTPGSNVVPGTTTPGTTTPGSNVVPGTNTPTTTAEEDKKKKTKLIAIIVGVAVVIAAAYYFMIRK